MNPIRQQTLGLLDKNLSVQPLTAKHKKAVIELIASTFAKKEPLAVSQKRSKEDLYPLVSSVVDHALELDLSNVVVDLTKDAEIVGATLNKWLSSELSSDSTPASYTQDLFDQLTQKFKLWKLENGLHYKQREVIDLYFGAVKKAYQGKQLYAHMIDPALKKAQKKGIKLAIVFTTNPGSSITFSRYFGFHTVASIDYAAFQASDGSANPFALIPTIFGNEKHTCDKCQLLIKQL